MLVNNVYLESYHDYTFSYALCTLLSNLCDLPVIKHTHQLQLDGPIHGSRYESSHTPIKSIHTYR